MTKRKWLIIFLFGAMGNVAFYAWQHDKSSLVIALVCMVMAIVVQLTAPEANR